MKNKKQYKINCFYDKNGSSAEEIILKVFDIYLKENINKTIKNYEKKQKNKIEKSK